MNKLSRLITATLLLSLPFAANAHRAWMLPSATILAGDTPWITVDAAVSNDIFYFEHFPLQIEGIGVPFVRPGSNPNAPARPRANLQITKPDGSLAQPQYGNTGRYRSTFDVELDQKGTWKLSIANQALFARYEVDGERKRWSGKLEDLQKQIPANAKGLEVIRSSSRNEVFVTSGATTSQVLAPTGKGLELVAKTHPNDLVSGEQAVFGFVLDGKPAAGVKVAIIREGIRYRDQLDEINLETDSKGEIRVDWQQPGMYWLEAVSSQQLKPSSASPVTSRRDSYVATLEVMAP